MMILYGIYTTLIVIEFIKILWELNDSIVDELTHLSMEYVLWRDYD